MSLCYLLLIFYLFSFFIETATSETYTLSLHDALPIFKGDPELDERCDHFGRCRGDARGHGPVGQSRAGPDRVLCMLIGGVPATHRRSNSTLSVRARSI